MSSLITEVAISETSQPPFRVEMGISATSCSDMTCSCYPAGSGRPVKAGWSLLVSPQRWMPRIFSFLTDSRLPSLIIAIADKADKVLHSFGICLGF